MWTELRTVKGVVGEEKEKSGVLHPKAENKRNRIRLCRREVVPGFVQAKIAVTTGASSLVVFEPLRDVRAHFRVDLAGAT